MENNERKSKREMGDDIYHSNNANGKEYTSLKKI